MRNLSLYFVSLNREGSPSEVPHQIEDEQDNEYEAEAATASGRASVSIATAAEEKNQDNNNEDEGHNFFDYLFFSAGDGKVASFSVETDEGVVTVSVGFTGA
jgi:hypothetical protein